MINNIFLKNFKSFEKAEVSPSYLNIFSGLNGMGKSTFLQALLLLRQSYRQNTLPNQGLLLNGDYIEIGTGKDAYWMYGSIEDNNIGIEVIWNENLECLLEFKVEDESDLLLLDKKDISDENVWKQALFTEYFQYLSAERIAPRTFFPASAYHVEKIRTLGNDGRFTIHFIGKNGHKNIPIAALAHPSTKDKDEFLTLTIQLDAWLGEISPHIKLNTILYKELSLAGLAYQYEVGKELTASIRPTNVGFGLTYVLPVVTAVLFSRPGDLLIIENPESHLHPKGQAQLGRLFALAAQQGVQIFIETHSDHILNGVRVATKQKLISPENVGIFFFNRNLEIDEHKTEIIQPIIDKNGRLSEWPKDFFDEWGNQLDELLK